MDVIEGRGPSPYFVLMLLRRLPEDSMTSALVQGGMQFFGWGTDRHMIASLYDAINLNTRASGNFKKPPKIPEFPRPTVKKKVTVKDLHAKMLGGARRR